MKMIRCFLGVVCALAIASSALAQTKVSGTLDCDKADPTYLVPVPGREGFAFGLSQNKCTWLKGGSVGGLQPAEFFNTTILEVTGASALSTAAGVSRYTPADAAYSRSTGTHDRQALTVSGYWTDTGATGRLLGIKGGGTYTCKMKGPEPGVGYTCEVQGEYTLPAVKK